MSATRPRLSILGFALALLAACSGGETVLGDTDGGGEADAAEDRVDADGSAPVCGNGTQEGEEECDDGNLAPTDGCTADCRIAYCGDGIVGTTAGLVEGFESGDLPGDEWTLDTGVWGWDVTTEHVRSGSYALGSLNAGWAGATASISLRARSSARVCFWWAGASCVFHGAFRFSVDGGAVLERSGENETWTQFCAVVTPGVHDFLWSYAACSTTMEPVGDAYYIDDLQLLFGAGSEACDDGAGNSDTEPDACRTDCSTPRCGDGVIDTGEECDDGNARCGDGCSPECEAGCGDGVVGPGEECDLTNLDVQTCVSRGHEAGGTLRCTENCRIDESGCRDPECGNGTCDLGETAAGCSVDCRDGCGDGSCAEAEDQLGCPADCGAVSVTVGGRHACALLADGTARCWGDNSYGGQLGDGTSVSTADPVAVSGLTGAVALDAGGFHTCALLSDGTGRCWGRNEGGQLGDGTNTDSGVPVTVAGVTDAIAIAAGAVPGEGGGGFQDGIACAVVSGGAVRCWGAGYGNVPLAVEGVVGVKSVSTGGTSSCGDDSCAVLANGGVVCWAYGQPAHAVVARGAVGASSGLTRSCALLSDGTGGCWGAEVVWALEPTCPFVAVPELTGAVGLSTGLGTCALRADGIVWCWGRRVESVAVGAPTYAESEVPTVVDGLSGAAVVASGGWSHSRGGMWPSTTTAPLACAALADGTVWCWGEGRMDEGTWLLSAEPVQVNSW